MTEKKAKKILYTKTPIDRIIDSYDCGKCWVFEGTAGGDLLIYKVYEDGTVTER